MAVNSSMTKELAAFLGIILLAGACVAALFFLLISAVLVLVGSGADTTAPIQARYPASAVGHAVMLIGHLG
jgi:hypothetical protein